MGSFDFDYLGSLFALDTQSICDKLMFSTIFILAQEPVTSFKDDCTYLICTYPFAFFSYVTRNAIGSTFTIPLSSTAQLHEWLCYSTNCSFLEKIPKLGCQSLSSTSQFTRAGPITNNGAIMGPSLARLVSIKRNSLGHDCYKDNYNIVYFFPTLL